MHPILARPERLAFYLSVWLAGGALSGLALRPPNGAAWWLGMTLSIPLALCFAFIGLASWYPCRANPLPSTAPGRVLAVHGAAATASSLLWLALGQAWSRLLASTGNLAGAAALLLDHRPLVFALGAFLYLFVAGLHYLLLAFEASRQAEQRLLEAKILAREAEIQAFKSQIDPHFLFNCLNSISSLCGHDPAAARRMTIRLGELLRASLRLARRKTIPLADELQLARAYLEVERVRFGDRLSYDEDVDDSCLDVPVPPLLLQPLLENALKHGLAHLEQGGTIHLEAARHGGDLRLAVENPCLGARRSEGEGIGVANVRGRLRLAYGAAATLRLGRGAGRFRVEVRLPRRPPTEERG